MPLFFPLFCFAGTEKGIIQQNILLKIGDHKEVRISRGDKFTITNKEIISHRTIENESKLLIRGIKSGHGELIIWTKKQKKIYDLLVTEVEKDLTTNIKLQSLSKLGLSVKKIGALHNITGPIQSIQDLKVIQHLVDPPLKNVIFNTTLTHSTQNEVRALVYKEFLKEGITSINCEFQSIVPTCDYNNQSANGKILEEKIYKKIKVNFVTKDGAATKRNYIIKMKIIQLERLDGMEIDLGLSQLSFSIQKILATGIESFIEENRALLKERNIQVSTLAEPILKIYPSRPSLIEIGGEYSYKTINEVTGRQNTDWKFAGLRIETTLNILNEKFQLDYNIRLTSPGPNNSVIGNKEKGSFSSDLGVAHKLFKVTLRTNGAENNQIPYLGSIPLIGRIFSSSNTSNNYKQIIGIMEINQDV